MAEPFSTSLGAFALTALIIEITPGPNMGYLAVLSLSRGWQAGAAAVTGVAIGHAVYGVAAALGVAALIDASPLLYEILRWAGVAYMLWLAWETWSSDTGPAPASRQAVPTAIPVSLFSAVSSPICSIQRRRCFLSPWCQTSCGPMVQWCCKR
jgi:threonine/homoserine/homoserine lactone efflux protein